MRRANWPVGQASHSSVRFLALSKLRSPNGADSMILSSERRSPIAPGKPREKRWDTTRALSLCADRSIARALRPIIYERRIS